MKKLTIATVALTALFFAATQATAGLIGNYTSATGALDFVYDGAEGNLAGIRLNSSAAGLVAGQATDLNGTITGALSVINDQAPNFVEWGNLVGFTFDNAAAGGVLPTGLDQGGLDAGYELLFRTLAAPTVDIMGTLTCTDCSPPDFTPNPADGSSIDLSDAYRNNGGLAPASISFTGTGTIDSVSVNSQSLPGLFGASIDGLNIDLTVDLPTGQTQPAGTMHDAVLNIVTSAGDFSYNLSATVPEPTTVGLAGLALIGLIGARRRS